MEENGNTRDVRMKIKKLLALGGSPNEHEAALAIEKAQELLDQYGLSMSEVEGLSEEVNQIVDQLFDTNLRLNGRVPKWQIYLFSGVCYAFDCQPYFQKISWKRNAAKQWKVIGYKVDIEAAVSTFYFLKNAAEMASDSYLLSLLYERDKERFGYSSITARASFCRGFAQSVIERVKDQRMQRLQSNCKTQALVLRKKDKVDAFAQKAHPDMKTTKDPKPKNFDYRAYISGKDAGAELNMNSEVSDRTSYRKEIQS